MWNYSTFSNSPEAADVSVNDLTGIMHYKTSGIRIRILYYFSFVMVIFLNCDLLRKTSGFVSGKSLHVHLT
jgi:hypothetical protein